MNKIILLVGASGSGKTTIGKELEERFVPQLVSFTTRPKRDGEVEGKDYYFKQDGAISTDDSKIVIESSTYGNNEYGLYKDEIDSKLERGDVYFICNKDGAGQIIEFYPDQVVYFWIQIDVSTMIERMRKRGDEEKNILDRIEHAVETSELVVPDYFEYVGDKRVSKFYPLYATTPLKENVDFIFNVLRHNQ